MRDFLCPIKSYATLSQELVFFSCFIDEKKIKNKYCEFRMSSAFYDSERDYDDTSVILFELINVYL